MIEAAVPVATAAQRRVAIDLPALGRLMGEHLPLPVAVTRGPAHVVEWVNPAFSRLARTPAAEIIGRPLEAVLPATRTEGAIALLDRVLCTGEAASMAQPVEDAQAARSYSVAPLFGALEIPEGLLVRVDETPELTPEGQPAATDDLREANQRLLLASLRAEEQFEEAAGEVAHFNALLESLHEGVTIVDSTGRVLLMNPAARTLFGDAPQASRGLSPSMLDRDLRHLDDRPVAPDESPIARALRDEGFKDEELVLVRRDGARLRLLSSGSAIRDNGEVVLAIIVDRDVTALRQLEQTKDDYLALISHDLRAPLTSLDAEAQLLQRQLLRERTLDSTHANVKRTQSILTNARRMNAMIQELLESSRLESGTMVLNREWIQIVSLLRDVVDRMGFERVQVRVEAELGDGQTRRDSTIFIDAERIERVLTNLITNALKYSPPTAPVVVRADQHGDATVVSVIDQGDGITPDELPRLFQRFTRGRSGPKADTSGLGLGLYIARLIVEAHGGRMWAESTPGNGSTFSFSLPTDVIEDQP